MCGTEGMDGCPSPTAAWRGATLFFPTPHTEALMLGPTPQCLLLSYDISHTNSSFAVNIKKEEIYAEYLSANVHNLPVTHNILDVSQSNLCRQMLGSLHRSLERSHIKSLSVKDIYSVTLWHNREIYVLRSCKFLS